MFFTCIVAQLWYVFQSYHDTMTDDAYRHHFSLLCMCNLKKIRNDEFERPQMSDHAVKG